MVHPLWDRYNVLFTVCFWTEVQLVAIQYNTLFIRIYISFNKFNLHYDFVQH